MRRGAKDLDERGREWTPPVVRNTNADAFTRNGERHRDAETAGGRDAVAAGIERLDLEVQLSTGSDQLTFSSSTSKTSVAFGGMTPAAPRAP